MIKLTCPGCQAKLQVPDEHIPAGGGWTHCPKCRGRFFIKPGGPAAADLIHPFPEPLAIASAPPRPDRGRDEATQKLLDRLKRKNRASQPEPGPEDFEADEITVCPVPALSPAACQYIGLALLSLPLLAIALVLYWGREKSLQPVSPAAPAAVRPLMAEESPEIIRADLRSIRRDLLRRRRSHIEVDYSGSESRVFKYFMGRLTPPGYCPGLDRLEIAALNPTEGYAATGFCLGEVYRSLEMKVSWTARGAMVQFANYPGQEEFEMFPRTTAVSP
jgi:Zn-finger nucleic acid-binding protein